MSVSLVELFPESLALKELQAKDKKSAIKEMVQHLVACGRLPSDASRKAERAIQRRETQGSTGIGKGLALPHAKGCAFIEEMVGLFARSTGGISFDSVDGGPVHVVFMVLSPKNCQSEHTEVMKRVAKLAWDEKTLNYLARDEQLESLEGIFKEVDDNAT